MVKTRSAKSRKGNYEASSRKRVKTCEDVRWSDLDHDVLDSVMMRLGVVEFVSFSGVCKSWRSLAHLNWKRFMASTPPMVMYVSPRADKMTCYLQEQNFEGRLFITTIPHLVGRKCVGLSCGYLILFGEKTRDFWLVNPITRHELHFPRVPFHVDDPHKKNVRAVLVFSRSKNAWVFVAINRFRYKIWFSIEGQGAWNHISNGTALVFDLHAFKGKIYALTLACSPVWRHVSELTFDPVPKMTVLDTRYSEPVSRVFGFISSDQNLYLMDQVIDTTYKVHRLGFDQLPCVPCVPCEKTSQEYVLFYSSLKFKAVLKPDSWAATSYGRLFDTRKGGKDGLMYVANRWYFPHDCLNPTLMDK